MRSAVRGWSPVMMMTRMPAACASRVATATSARGGSMMPTVPTQISRCSSPLCASGLSPASRGRYASPAFAAQRRPMHPRRSGCAAARRCRVQAWLTPHALSCIAPAARQAPFAITTEASSWSWSASMVDIILRADVNGIKGWRAGPRAPPPGPRQRQSAIGKRWTRGSCNWAKARRHWGTGARSATRWRHRAPASGWRRPLSDRAPCPSGRPQRHRPRRRRTDLSEHRESMRLHRSTR